MRRFLVPSAGVRLLFLVALGGCSKHEAAEHAERPPPIPVRVAYAERRLLQPSFEVIGTVQADPERQATLTAAVPGLIDRLVVTEGTRVEAKALIVQLDDRQARTDLNRAEAAYARLIAKPRPEELAQAQALVDKMRAAHALAQARLIKAQELRARNPDLVPEVQLLDDQRNAEVARADVATAQAQLQLLEKGPREEQRREAKVEVEAAQLQLDFCRIVAPFAGEVTQITARVGQRADVGMALATILDTREVWVQARVPGNRLAGLLAAQQSGGHQPVARIVSPSFPGTVFPATASWLSQQTEGITADVPIKLRVPNPDGLLRIGMTVRVELFEAAVEHVAIPDTAFTVNENGQYVVTVIRDGKAVPTEIELTPPDGFQVRAGGWIRVVKGLEPGDAVAIEKGYGLPENTPVTVVASTESTADAP